MTLPFPSLEDLVDAVRSAIDYVINVIYTTVRDALISFYNWLMGSIEWLLNYLRGYIPIIVTIIVTWNALYKLYTNPNISIEKKILGIVGTPIASVLVGGIIDGLLPREIRLPRWSYPPLCIASTYAYTMAKTEYVIIGLAGYVGEAYAETEARGIYSLA